MMAIQPTAGGAEPAMAPGPNRPSSTPNRPLGFILAASGAEGFGDALTRTLLPILTVTVLGLGTGFVGLLNAVSLTAFLLLGMPIGMLIDRIRNRTGAMGASTLTRCLVGVLLTAGYWADLLSGPVLLGAAVLLGVADVVFATAQSTVLPAAVPAPGLKAAYSRMMLVNQGASTTAAAAGSAALALIGLPGMMLAAAASYAGSLLFQRGIRINPARPAPRKGAGGQFRHGFTTLRRTPALWALTLSGCLTNAGAMLGNTVLPVFILRDLGVEPAVYAALGLVSAAGAMAGAAAAPRLTSGLGLRVLRTGAALLAVPAVGLAAVCQWLPGPDIGWLAGQSLAWSFLVSLSAVAGAEVLPRTVAPEELATVGSAQRTLTLGVMPAAAVLGGAAAGLAGPVPLLMVWALLSGAAALPLFREKSLDAFR
jgi:Na+/melibiose symporter-like transporter